MAIQDSSERIGKLNPAQLSQLLTLGEKTAEVWDARDLAGMLRHQMAAPLNFDLTTLPLTKLAAKTRDQNLAEAATARIKSFGDLLFLAEPPLELLRLSKEFFKKRIQSHKEQSPEWQIAYLFYLLIILAAGVGVRTISTLTPGELLKGVQWALDQNWVDAQTKQLVARMRSELKAEVAD